MPNLFDGPRPSDDAFLSEDEQTHLIERIEDLLGEDNLNEWELGFLDSCLKRVQGGRDLSEKQYKKLDDIEVEVPLRLSPDDFGDGQGDYGDVF